MNTCLYANDIDSYACKVYTKNWPDGSLHQEDIKLVTAEDVCRRGVPDLICGGFPCQDVSYAGKGAGLADGTRSGLWSEMFRLVCEVRPRYVVVENVPGLLGRGLGKVLADLASVGFDAEWQVLPAAAFGAPHIRERVFVLAYTKSEQGDRRERGRIQPLSDWWSIESPVCKLANGIPNRVAQLKCLGNAIVPQVAQFVGECIMAHNGGEFTFAELFCGIGGFRLGFEWASGREETT